MLPLLLWVSLIGSSVAVNCVNITRLLTPCECTDMPGHSSYPELLCSNITRPDQLTKIFELVAASRQTITTFRLQDSNLRFLPGGLFRKVPIRTIHFDNSKILSISYPDNLFEGLEETLKFISVNGNPYILGWQLSNLKFLRKLETLHITDCDLATISKDFFQALPESLSALKLENDGIRSIDDHALSGMNGLNILDLSSNNLTRLPEGLPKRIMDLTAKHNGISELSPRIFSDLTAINTIHLENNQFTTLDRGVLEKVPMNTLEYIRGIYMENNPLDCCSFTWLADLPIRLKFKSGACTKPEKFRGLPISGLDIRVKQECRK